jgi:phage replication-related protein YjqB (UPF0714/DUF867 family)
MLDKYASFAELAATERDGQDYRIRALERAGSPVIVLAPHGGGIEIGTSELAEMVAGTDHSLFVFEGLKPYGANRDLHITSHRFDHPHCLALTSAHDVTLSIHGCRGESHIFLGGLDSDLSARLAKHLTGAGLTTSLDGHGYPGRHPLNICNRSARGRGAQIEITRDLRSGEARRIVADAVRAAVEDYLAPRRSA